MKKMTMIAGALSLAFINAPLLAYGNDMCNFELEYDLSVKNSEINFNNDNGKDIRINQDNQLYFNGAQQSLSDEQQALVDDYADGVRDLIPEVTAIAIEGVNIGVKAASMALSTLFGEGEPEFERFNQKVADLAYSITMILDSNNFSTKELEKAFDEDFQSEIESVVESAVKELAPKVMAKMVTAALSGDEQTVSDLEMRADALGDDIEHFIEPQTEALEARADELCDSIESLNSLEDKMVEHGLDMMDLIQTNGGSKRKSHGKMFNFNLGD